MSEPRLEPRGEVVRKTETMSEEHAAATLAALPRMSASRLLRVLTHWPTPSAALAAVSTGDAGAAFEGPEPKHVALARSWASATAPTLTPSPTAIVPTLERRGTRVVY